MPRNSHGQPPNRRDFLRSSGTAAVGLGLALLRRGALPSGVAYALSRGGNAFAVPPTNPLNPHPILELSDLALGPSETIGGLPFASRWHGDWFGREYIPLHSPEDGGSGGALTEPIVDVAIIGGGLSGLAAAHLLPDAKVALFDLRPRLGGNALGERWRGVPYSLGSAYFMVAGSGTAEDALYHELGVYDTARIDTPEITPFEFEGAISQDPCANCSDEMRLRYHAFRAALAIYAGKTYPDIPMLPKSERLVRELDVSDFRSSVRAAAGGELPPLVEASLQAYCYSSFGVGWQELSAAAGWNFIAAEEYGRIVLPGGNAGLAALLWRKIAQREGNAVQGTTPIARTHATVISVEAVHGSVLIRWRDAHGRARITQARDAVMCCPLHVARHLVTKLETLDEPKLQAMHRVESVAYVVANVLLEQPTKIDHYDIFTIHDKEFPRAGEDCEFDRRITDVLDGSFAPSAGAQANADVLTLYWPLPWHTARFSIVHDDDWRSYAEIGAPQIDRILSLVGSSRAAVKQIRMTRWGHAMSFAVPGFYGSNAPLDIQRPFEGHIHFAHQDVWALPAWETCLAEARRVVAAIGRG